MTRPAQAPQHPRPGQPPGGLHYGWVIVGILVMVQVIGSAISQSAGVMVAPLRDPHGGFGWGIGTIGVLMAVYYVVGALFSPVSGWLGERYGARCLMLAGGVLYGGSMVLLGLVRQPWHFLLTFSLLLSLTQSICMVPLMAAVSGWFRRRLGLATGILWAAGGLGAAGLAPLVSVLLDTLGWQGTFWSLGIIGGGLILSLTLLFRNRPADLGLTPYGATAADPPAVVRSPAVERLRRQVFTRHMRHTRAFWYLPLIHGLGCAGHGIVLLYVVPLAVERGLTLVSASVILSLIAVCSIGSRLLTPIVAERAGGKPIIAAALLIQGLTVQPLRHRLWRGDDSVSGGQPPVFRDGTHQHPVWLRDDGRPARARCGERAGWPGALRHELVCARPAAVHGLQSGGGGGDPAPGIHGPGAHPALGSVGAP